MSLDPFFRIPTDPCQPSFSVLFHPSLWVIKHSPMGQEKLALTLSYFFSQICCLWYRMCIPGSFRIVASVTQKTYCQPCFLQWVAKSILELKSWGLMAWFCCIIPAERDLIGKDPVMSKLPPDPSQQQRAKEMSAGGRMPKSTHQRVNSCVSRTADCYWCVTFFWARISSVVTSTSHSSSSSTVILHWKEAEWNGRKLPVFPHT